jgi:ABC-type antimicrobial peptide transport system permease subunit
VGINTAIFAGGFSFSGLAWDPIWRAVLSFKVVVIPIVVMCFICTVASLYPAIIAARLDPVRAIHHT